MQAAERLLRRADKQQQQRPWIAFPYAVMKKFGDDQAGNLAALIAYYGFLSLFPLMLVLVTLLGLLLRNNPELQDTIRTSALANFPVLGEQISNNVHSLRGSDLALGIGLALSLWAGLGVMKVLQTAMKAVWNVPYRHRPNFWLSLLRAMIMLLVLGVITIASRGGGKRRRRQRQLAAPDLRHRHVRRTEPRLVPSRVPNPDDRGRDVGRCVPRRIGCRGGMDHAPGHRWVHREPSAAGCQRHVRDVRDRDRPFSSRGSILARR